MGALVEVDGVLPGHHLSDGGVALLVCPASWKEKARGIVEEGTVFNSFENDQKSIS